MSSTGEDSAYTKIYILGHANYATHGKDIVCAGVSAIVQPGGSIRDEESIETANQNGMSMLFTGMRHFKH